MSYKILVLISWKKYLSKKASKNGSVFKLHGSHKSQKSQKSPWAITHCKKKTGFAIITWNRNNPKQLGKPCITKGQQLPVNLWGPDFPMVPKVIGGGPRLDPSHYHWRLHWSLLPRPKFGTLETDDRDTAGTGVNVGGAETNDGKGFRCGDRWREICEPKVQDHLEVGLRIFLKGFLFDTWGFSWKLEKTIKIKMKVLNYHYHVFKNPHLSKSRWKEKTSIL